MTPCCEGEAVVFDEIDCSSRSLVFTEDAVVERDLNSFVTIRSNVDESLCVLGGLQRSPEMKCLKY